MIFENIIGNEKNKKLLEDIIAKNKIANAYMFIGQESIGKFLFAKEFAKAILCLNENKPCNKCKSCLELENSNNPDLTIIEPDGNNVKIEQIRELNKKVVEKPIVSTKKVYIINDGQNITKEAQNALLKTLEEPPEYVTIILITTSESAFLPTIKSRCTKIAFSKLTDDELLKYANIHNIHVNSNLLGTCEGSISKLLSLNDNLSLYNSLDLIIDNFNNKDIVDVWNEAEVLYKSKDNILDFLDYFNIIFMNKLRNTNDSRYINAIKIVEKTKNRLSANANYDMCIDNLLLQIWEEFHESHNRG